MKCDNAIEMGMENVLPSNRSRTIIDFSVQHVALPSLPFVALPHIQQQESDTPHYFKDIYMKMMENIIVWHHVPVEGRTICYVREKYQKKKGFAISAICFLVSRMCCEVVLFKK